MWYCENGLYVEGDNAQLGEFERRAKTRCMDLSFDRLVPVPKELARLAKPARIVSDAEYHKALIEAIGREQEHPRRNDRPITKEMVQDLISRFGATNRYDWCDLNWGVLSATPGELIRRRNGLLYYVFDTPDAVPVRWLVEVSKQFPSLKFTLEFTADGTGVDGVATCVNGVVEGDDADEWM